MSDEPTRAAARRAGWPDDARPVRRHDGPAAEGEELRRVGAPAARACSRRSARSSSSCSRSRSSSVALSVERPEDPRPRDRHHLRGLPRHAAAATDARQAVAMLAPGNARPIVDAWTSARPRHRLRARSRDVLVLVMRALRRARRCSCGCRATSSTTSCSARCKRLRADVEAKLMRVPLVVLRRPAARRDAEPRHERHRQRRAWRLQQTLSQILDGAADRARRARDARRDLAAARADRARHGAAVGRRSPRRSASARRRASSRSGSTSARSTVRSRRRSPATRWSRCSAGARRSRSGSARRTTSCSTPSFRAQFISSMIMPAINFVGNLNYVAIAVVGGLRVASGAMLLGSVQAFIQYSRQFTQQLGQLAQVANVLQSGVASAERVFELLDAPDQSPDRAARGAAGAVARRGPVRGRQRSATSPTCR